MKSIYQISTIIQFLENIHQKNSKNFFLIAGSCIIEVAEIVSENPFLKENENHIYAFIGLNGIEETLLDEFNAISKSENEKGFTKIYMGKTTSFVIDTHSRKYDDLTVQNWVLTIRPNSDFILED